MDEQKLPLLILKDDYVVASMYRGAIQVESGTCTILGTLHGTLIVCSGAAAYISGLHQGNLHILTGGKVNVIGTIQGTIKIAPMTLLVFEEAASFDGLLLNNGEIIVRGVISGGLIGSGSVSFEGNGKIKGAILRDTQTNMSNHGE